MNEKYKTLDEFSLSILKQISVLPPIWYPADVLFDWLKIPNTDEDKENFVRTLNLLIKEDFLLINQNSLHCPEEKQKQIVNDFKPNVLDCEKLIETFIWKLTDETFSTETPLLKKEYLTIAEFISKTVTGRNVHYARLLNNISYINHELGNVKRAKAFLETSIKIYEEIDQSEPWRLSTSYNNLAEICRITGENENALKYGLIAIKIGEDHFSKFNFLEHATSYHTVALICYSLKRYDEAEKYELRAISFLDLISIANKAIHPKLPSSYDVLAQICSARKDPEKSLEYQYFSIKLAESLYPENHPFLGSLYNNLSNLYLPQHHEEGRMDKRKSLEIRKKAIAIYESNTEINYPELGTIYANHAFNHLLLNEFEYAMEFVERAKVIFEAYLPKGHPQFANLEQISLHAGFGFMAESMSWMRGEGKIDWDDLVQKEMKKNQ